MEKFQSKIDVDTKKTIISSHCLFKKTENFLMQTKYILNLDFFLSKIAGSIAKEFENLFSKYDKKTFCEKSNCFKIETTDKAFSFLIKFGFQLGSDNEQDIVFYKFLHSGTEIRQNDTKIQNYLKKNDNFSIYLTLTTDFLNDTNFNKLYRLTNEHGISFPFLSKEQLEIVATENKNVIVQGVAGSGKTNVCIEKLVWTASKNYGGKILYTTFSRGLLNDTKLKVEAFKNSLKTFLEQLENNQVIFLDNDHKKAIENHLGIFFFANEFDIPKKIKNMIAFFENNVDYFLIEDLYKKYFSEKMFANEEYFIKEYFPQIKNHQITNKLSKLKNLSQEIIYKEIFGLIFGYFNQNNQIISQEDYLELRKDNFEKTESETIYQIAQDYKTYLFENNLTDNNFASREMIDNIDKIDRYSLIVADEVQDFSQINLVLFKKISLKLFCTGDALQMINPSYFSFGFLKNLLFEKDMISVAELKNNYRNTQKIQNIIDGLEEINTKKFGVHNFITSGKGIETSISTTAIYCNTDNFVSEISKNKYENFTIVVPTKLQKLLLQQKLKNQEILTIAEIKGLERDTVLLYNLLSDNLEKWNLLERMTLNRKTADENSVFRYYFNIFYVGVSRAKQNLFIVESKNIESFKNFFKENFDCQDRQTTINSLSKIISKIEFTQDEYIARVNEFLKLEQFDNAKFNAEKITDDLIRANQILKVDIYKNFVHFGKYREAGIRFWENGMIEEAKKQFILSGDTALIDLITAVSEKNQTNLNFDIIKYFNDVKENDIARQFILETITKDITNLKENQKRINENFKKMRGNKYGK